MGNNYSHVLEAGESKAKAPADSVCGEGPNPQRSFYSNSTWRKRQASCLGSLSETVFLIMKALPT